MGRPDKHFAVQDLIFCPRLIFINLFFFNPSIEVLVDAVLGGITYG
jgi:hypothetical protein